MGSALPPLPPFRQFIGQRFGVVDFAERFDDCLRVHCHGTRLLVGVHEVEHERLDVAVENQADDFRIPIDDGASRIAADDVGRADEVERRVEVDLVLSLDPAGRQVEGSAVVMFALRS